MTILWSNNASTTVSGSITAVSTSVALAAGTGVMFPSPTGSDYYVATFYDQATKTQYEIVHVTAMAGDTATIVRAQEGTTAQAWSAGDLFANLVTAGTLRNFVQAGAGPADTSLVYVGTDTSATPNLIVCNTVPVPSNYAVGMIFNILVKNTNTGPVQLQLNGVAGVAATRTDGSALVGGNLTGSQEMSFIFNGVNFTSLVPPIPQEPPQTTFYVNPSGNDNNSGFADTAAEAFATISGAMYQIKQRYISQGAITIRVDPGSYTDAVMESSSYIAAWDIIGNPSNPATTVINATSVTAAAYPPHAGQTGASCLVTDQGNVTITGFTFQSYFSNVGTSSGGRLSVYSCNFTAPTGGSGGAISADANGTTAVYGNCQYSGAVAAVGIFEAQRAGTLVLGSYNPIGSINLVFDIVGTPTITDATALSAGAGVMIVYNQAVAFTGGIPNCAQYQVWAAGGINFVGGTTNIFPGTQPGTVTAPGWTAAG